MQDMVEVDAGPETLEIMGAAPRYNAWQYSRVAPFLGRRVCEVGSGIGNMSSLILETPRELTVLTDTSPYYLETLKERFGGRPDVAIEPLTLPDDSAPERFAKYRLDTVVALNVVEHIPEDVGALRTIAALLPLGGRLVVLVPALRQLYGTLDLELSHARRYTRAILRSTMEAAGFRVEQTFYYNLGGTFGWWFNSRVLRARRIDRSQLRLFEALVPVLRIEDRFRLPFGQSVIGVGMVS
jgi:SAM-dependent methyltransferase